MKIVSTPQLILNSKFTSVDGSKVAPQSLNFKANMPTKKSKIFEPLDKGYDELTTYIANKLIKVFDTSIMKGCVNKLKNSNNQIAHLITVASVILTGFYIQKTLTNEKLDEMRRKTLAINQGIVTGVSILMAYTLDNVINKQFNIFSNKFKSALPDKENWLSYEKGLKSAKTIMIFDLINRFVTPVLVTPIANAIGDKLHERKKNKSVV